MFNAGEALGMPNQQVSTIFKTVIKVIDQRLPGLIVKIDHHVSTKDEIK
jgi:hypothetical protein